MSIRNHWPSTSLFRFAGPFAAAVLLSLQGFPTAALSGAKTAIDFKATDLNGESYMGSEELKGKVVLLDFWAIWCAPCVKAMPKLSELRQEFKADGFEVLGLASYSGTIEDVRRFLEKRRPSYPIVMADDDIVEQFRVVGYPTYFLVDRQGGVAETYVGEIESQFDEVRERIKDLLFGGKKE